MGRLQANSNCYGLAINSFMITKLIRVLEFGFVHFDAI